MIGLFNKIRKRIRQIFDSPEKVARRAAPRIQARLRADATTKRGNVPQFAPGPSGNWDDIPITATAKGNEIDVRAPDWVMKKADEKGQKQAWIDIVKDEAGKV